MVISSTISGNIYAQTRYLNIDCIGDNHLGNYEYPFEVSLPDDIPDSVEGLPGGHIIYKMKAVIERPGLVNKNFTCRKVLPKSDIGLTIFSIFG
jgi:hypothetical protein